MAQTMAQSPSTGPKRGPGRPPTRAAAQPPLKKVKTSETPIQSSPSVQSPAVQSPAPAKGANKLPTKLSDYRPLPTLPTPQSLSLQTSTHQSLAASAVLQASFDRSRLRWVHHGVFDRYWTKPETGKNARPPPPNNPEAKWMKPRGPCRIRVEPHIFECEVYVEDKPKPPVQKVQPQGQYGQGAYGGYGQQYRPGQAYAQQRPLGAVQQGTPVRQSPAPQPPGRSQPSTPQQQPEKKGPDPVISMLANRASSDPELKALMKEVATGAATPEQLKVFQGHIDDLTKIIDEKKKKEEEEAASAEAKKAQEQPQDSIQYDGAADQKAQPAPQTNTPYHPPQQAWRNSPHPPPTQPPAPAPPPPPPTNPPVILQFTTPGATEDRFLFPRHSIIESLSPQHLLCSTLITRKGIAATDPCSLNPATEYFQPVTFMVEVAYGRENLIELVKKFVRPAEEVRVWMTEVMGRCTRAPDAHLALRLPVRGAEGAETEEERVAEEEEGRKKGGFAAGLGGVGGNGSGGQGHGANVKYVKKPGPKKGEGGRPVGVKNGEGGGKRGSLGAAGAKGVSTPAAVGGAQVTPTLVAAVEKEKMEVKEGDAGSGGKDGVGVPSAEAGKAAEKKDEVGAATGAGTGAATGTGEEESGRPKRAVRKSVRISEPGLV